MEFVRYIINCFKVYYPKFLCKLQELLKSKSAANIHICFINSLLRFYSCYYYSPFFIVSAKMIIVDMPWIMNGENEPTSSQYSARICIFL